MVRIEAGVKREKLVEHRGKYKQVAIADPSGKALALTQTDAATLTIKWADQQCQAPYSLPERNKALNYERVRLMCTS